MADQLTRAEQREATHVLGEMAASRLFALIHERLEELRAKGAFPQAEIAARLGVSEQLVSRWLREPRNMTVRGAGRLLGALDAHLMFELDRFEDILGQGASNRVVVPAAPRSPTVHAGRTNEAKIAEPPSGNGFRIKEAIA